MDKNGYDTSRRIVTKEPYRGYHIIKTTSKKHHWSDISRKFLDSIEKTIVEFTLQMLTIRDHHKKPLVCSIPRKTVRKPLTR